MLAVKRSAGVAPEVNLRNLLCAGKIARKPGIHPGFGTQGRHHQKSKTGVSVAPQKGLKFSKKILKKENWTIEPGTSALNASYQVWLRVSNTLDFPLISVH